MDIVVKCGDMTKEPVDAIVHPANSFMTMGGGLAAAIRVKGGEIIRSEAQKFAPVPIGKAIVTTAGKLSAKKVIHAPTMVQGSSPTTTANAKKALLAILNCAEKNNLKSIAVSGLGTGVGRVPRDECAKMMVQTIRAFKAKSLKKVVLIDNNKTQCAEFTKALKQ